MRYLNASPESSDHELIDQNITGILETDRSIWKYAAKLSDIVTNLSIWQSTIMDAAVL